MKSLRIRGTPTVCLVGVIALIAFLGSMARADEVILKNGDKLTGKISALTDGKIAMNVPGIGDIKIDAAGVKTLSTDAPVTVRLADGTNLIRKLDADPSGGVLLPGGLFGTQHLPVSDVAAVNEPVGPVYAGDIKFGGLLIRGNTNTDSLNLGVDFSRTTKQDEFTISGTYLYGRTRDRITGVTTTTADNWALETKYIYNFTDRFYAFADILLQKDRLAFLDLRFTPSAGVGYRLINQADLKFSTEAGLAWVYENYTNNTPTREDFSLKLAYHLVKNFSDKVSIIHNLEYYPSLENFKNYIVLTDAALRATLTEHFFTEFKVAVTYDSDPAIGALKFNEQFALNVGYKL